MQIYSTDSFTLQLKTKCYSFFKNFFQNGDDNSYTSYYAKLNNELTIISNFLIAKLHFMLNKCVFNHWLAEITTHFLSERTWPQPCVCFDFVSTSLWESSGTRHSASSVCGVSSQARSSWLQDCVILWAVRKLNSRPLSIMDRVKFKCMLFILWYQMFS